MTEPSDESTRHLTGAASDSALLVVGIGAAAGGIEAPKRLLAAAYADEGAAYILVLDLLSDSDTNTLDALRAATALPIELVSGRVPIVANHVYLIASHFGFAIEDGHIIAGPLAEHQNRARLDLAFRTISETYGPRAVAIVLSGTGSSGSNGLKHVQEYGGLTLAQDPDEAECGEMPRHAVASGTVDYVLLIAHMAAAIRDYRHRLRAIDDSDLAAPPLGDAAADTFRAVLALVQGRTGHDSSKYKTSTVLCRIRRRMSVVGVTTLAEYLKFMHRHAEEAPMLLQALLVHARYFFRDPPVFLALERHVVPHLFREGAKDAVRVWIAGSGTGEEAYSVAMLLAEHAATMSAPPSIEVFASDLDERSIATARAGVYSESEVADVSPERLQRFFARETSGYRVRRELREMLLFSRHDIMKDPPFGHLDLVRCRNVLSQFNRSIQERLIQTFHFALRPGGYLSVGSSDSQHQYRRLFAIVDQEHHLYQSRGSARGLFKALDRSARSAVRHGRPSLFAPPADSGIPLEIHHQLLEEYAPPSLAIADNFELLHVSKRAGRYLQVPAGDASSHILNLIHPGLRTDLRAALHRAAHRRSSVVVRDVRLTIGQHEETVTLHIRRVVPSESARGFYLIVFAPKATAPPAIGAVPLSSDGRFTPRDEERHLSFANQHLQAANEDLRSSSDALETSKRELESLNQELRVINDELRSKIDELRVTNNDFRNFIHATNIPTIFLDRQLLVKLVTVRAQDVFKVRASDIGRPLADIPSSISYDGVLADAAAVLEHLQAVEREVRSYDGGHYLMRILPYRTVDDHIEGVVLTFIDVTGLRHAEAAVLATEKRLRQALERGQADLEERVRVRTEELQQEQARVRGLLHRLVSLQEEQRTRVARDLHDQLGQQLTALRLTLERAQQRSDGDSRHEDLARGLVLTGELNTQLDLLAWELRPAVLDDLGLAAALPRFLREWTRHCGIEAEVSVAGFTIGDLSKDAEVAFYRIVQESLTNVLKHSQASRVDVVLETRGGLVTLLVADDGVGFDMTDRETMDAGFGLMGMHERAGVIGATLVVESAPHQGTTVYLRANRQGASCGAETR